MQVNNAKAMSARAEAVKALVKPKEVESKMPKGASGKLGHLALFVHPKHGKHAGAHMTRERRLNQSKAKAQAKTQAATPAPVSALAPAPKGAQVPAKAP
ncbi:60S ribosomal protein L29 [Sciurus carolinensis]|uniref:60S ribosomal protein L29 n=1 Tax=Sciurus carolinensis TaxID=30640 RepID=A0AA41NHK8_SCICA|nr:60S ribosomal protein L29 [Sciurus carolinensis]